MAIDGFNRKVLRAFVRIDGMGRVVAGSLILRRQKPKVGRWREIPAYLCCAPSTTVGPGNDPEDTTTTTTTVAPTTTTTTTIP